MKVSIFRLSVALSAVILATGCNSKVTKSESPNPHSKDTTAEHLIFASDSSMEEQKMVDESKCAVTEEEEIVSPSVLSKPLINQLFRGIPFALAEFDWEMSERSLSQEIYQLFRAALDIPELPEVDNPSEWMHYIITGQDYDTLFVDNADIQQHGDSATAQITYKTISQFDDSRSKTLQLIKEKGRWVIDDFTFQNEESSVKRMLKSHIEERRQYYLSDEWIKEKNKMLQDSNYMEMVKDLSLELEDYFKKNPVDK